MRLLLGCLLAHALLADLAAWPWWVPNLTVVGLVLAVVRRPERWVACSALAGLFATLCAVRVPGPIFVSYVVLGWTVRVIGTQWDTNEPRVRFLLVAAACLVTTLYAVWLDGLWSLAILGWIVVHTVVTTLLVPVIQRR